MAYNPYDAINKIYNMKGQYESTSDEEQRKQIANNAKTFYDQLRNSGYGSVADELSNSSYSQAKNINDYYGKTGKTAVRDYLYKLAPQYDLTSKDIDNNLSFDGQTGEISFGGKNIGKPNSIVDGKSYMDSNAIEGVFKNFVSTNGITRSKETAVNQENEGLFKKYNDEYDYLKNTNPLETETAKSILARYDLKALDAKDASLADGASTNSGNIDSFSAANAARNQAALRSMGEQSALTAHQQRLDNARTLLSGMGANIDRVFNQDQTAKNNEVARNSQSITNDINIMNATGQVLPQYSNNPYVGANMDFQAEINKLLEQGASPSDTRINQLKEARALKIKTSTDPNINKLSYEYYKPTSQETANVYLNKLQMKNALDISSGTNATNKAITAANNQNALDQINAQTQGQKEVIQEQSKYGTGKKPTLTASQVLEYIKSGNITQGVIDAYNYYNNSDYTVDNPPTITDSKGNTYGGADDTTPYQKAVAIVQNNDTDNGHGALKYIVDNRVNLESELGADYEKLLFAFAENVFKKDPSYKDRNMKQWEIDEVLNQIGGMNKTEANKFSKKYGK